MVFPGTYFVLPTPVDLDGDLNGFVRFQVQLNCSELEIAPHKFDDRTDELRLTLVESLDREVIEACHGHVIALDGGSPPLSGSLDLVVMVTDANDNAPKFERPVYVIGVLESAPVGTVLGTVRATDPDSGLNGRVSYELATQADPDLNERFFVNESTGEIVLRRTLDHETDSGYALSVSARDLGPGSVRVYARVTIGVEDVNDCAPAIRAYTGVAEVPENAPPGAFVAQLSVVDNDAGDNGRVECNVSSQLFSLVALHPTVLKLATNSTFDREQRAAYAPEVTCRDFGLPSLHVTLRLPVEVADVNDVIPKFRRDVYEANVPEDCSPGSTLFQVIADDDDDAGNNSAVRYRLSPGGATLLSVDDVTGSVVVVGEFDYENRTRHSFVVIASDQGREVMLSSSATILVNVIDVNDEAPEFSQGSYSFGTYENQPPGSEVGYLSAFDRDSEPFNRFNFSIEGAARSNGGGALVTELFHVDPETGRITARRSLDRELLPVHRFVAVATDTEHPYYRSTVDVTVHVADRNDNAPLIEFPAHDGHVVRVLSRGGGAAAAGKVVAAVRARDADLGENARLVYGIAAGNELGMFTIDPDNGDISTTKAGITVVQSDRVLLVILVTDCGVPAKSAVVTMEILIDKDDDGEEEEDGLEDPGLSSSNTGYGRLLWNGDAHRLIVASLISLCALLLTFLVLVVVCVKVRRRSIEQRNRRTSHVIQGEGRFKVGGSPIVSWSKVESFNSEQQLTDVEREERDVSVQLGTSSSTLPRTKNQVHQVHQVPSPGYSSFHSPPAAEHRKLTSFEVSF